MSSRTLEAALQKEKEKSEQEVNKASKAVVKPDTRKLPATRSGKKNLSTWVSPEAHTEVKVIAAKENKSIEDVVRDAVNLKLGQHGLPPIA